MADLCYFKFLPSFEGRISGAEVLPVKNDGNISEFCNTLPVCGAQTGVIDRMNYYDLVK